MYLEPKSIIAENLRGRSVMAFSTANNMLKKTLWSVSAEGTQRQSGSR
jgi:hypothetical protein